jgi:hypothetical protein
MNEMNPQGGEYGIAAVGGLSRAKLTSDAYGDASGPGYQFKIIGKISFLGLDLSALHSTKGG